MEYMKEVWKRFRDFNYEVSNHGAVRRVHKKTPTYRVLKNNVIKDGYLRVDLSHKSVAKHFSVHRLVAEVFLPNPENKPVINHKDCNPANNHVSNLEWATVRENTIHARDNGLLPDKKGENAGGAKLKPENVLEIRSKGLKHKTEFISRFGISVQTLYDIVERKSWTHI